MGGALVCLLTTVDIYCHLKNYQCSSDVIVSGYDRRVSCLTTKSGRGVAQGMRPRGTRTCIKYFLARIGLDGDPFP